jgi:hypothetical protein
VITIPECHPDVVNSSLLSVAVAKIPPAFLSFHANSYSMCTGRMLLWKQYFPSRCIGGHQLQQTFCYY